jgi:hypothetical protein
VISASTSFDTPTRYAGVQGLPTPFRHVRWESPKTGNRDKVLHSLNVLASRRLRYCLS